MPSFRGRKSKVESNLYFQAHVVQRCEKSITVATIDQPKHGFLSVNEIAKTGQNTLQ
jgi:hypothetical protein